MSSLKYMHIHDYSFIDSHAWSRLVTFCPFDLGTVLRFCATCTFIATCCPHVAGGQTPWQAMLPGSS